MKRKNILLFLLLALAWAANGQQTNTLLTEGFESSTLNTTYQNYAWYSYNAGSGNNWLFGTMDHHNGSNCAYYSYHGSNAANCYMVSMPFSVNANMTRLSVSLYEKVQGSSYPETFEVFFIKASDVTTLEGVASATKYVAITSASYTNDSDYAEQTGYSTSSALKGQSVRVVVHCTSAANMWRLYIDDLTVTETVATTYTVTYNANGGSGTMTDPNSPYASGSTVTVMSNAFTAPSGMTFSGWNTAADGSGTSYDPNDTFNISANTTLYAQWTASTGSECAEIGTGTNATSGGGYGGIYTYWNYYAYTQQLYTAAELTAAGASAGVVESIALKYAESTDSNLQFDVYLGQTTSTTVSTSWITDANLTRVYNGTTPMTFSGNGQWNEIDISGANWEWDGTSSIVVAIHRTTNNQGSVSYPDFYYTSASNMTVYYSNSSSFTLNSSTYVPSNNGTATNNRPDMKFCINSSNASCEAIGENSTSNGTSSSDAGYTPINLYYNYSYNQMVYDGSSMPTTINSISFKYKSTYAVTEKTNVDIYLGETTSTTLSSYMSASDLTKVYSGPMDFPANSDGWVEFTFNENGGSFSHDQSKNIVVVVNDKSGAYPTSNYAYMYFYFQTGSSGVHMYSRNDSSGAYSVPPSSGTASTYLPVVRFCGSSVVTIPTHTITATADPTAGGTVSFMTGPANSTTARTHLPLDSYRNYSFSQQIYTPDEVGGGTISSISLYSVDGNLNDGVDFTRTLAVYMAHTDKTEFSSTSDWISNSDSPDMTLVYSGNVTFDCGEWNTINFTNSFNYDGTRNLVLIIADNTGTSAPAGNYLECKTFTPSSGGYCSLNDDSQFNPSSPSGNGEMLTQKNQILINPGSSDSRGFPEGASCTLVATPNDGYRFVNWTENNSTVGNSTTYTISNIQADHDLVAHFERDSYTLTTSANPSAGGTVSPSGNNTYTPGTSVQLSATANTGYSFTNWTENGSVLSSNANYTITMNADHTVVANFTQNNYTISYSPTSSNPSNGCYISGNTSAHYGDNITVTLHVATGYELRSITATDGNNNTVTLTGSGSTYTFSMPASNVTVTAEFKRACMVPTNLAESTTINSATITWDDSYGSEWQVAHATSSSANPDNNIISPNVTEQTYTMGNLTLGSTHYFWVRSYCSVSEQSAWVGPVEVVIECTAPGNTLSATATSTGAVLTWTGGTGEEYIVELGTPVTTTTIETLINETFEGVTGVAGYSYAGSLPSGWNYIWNNTTYPNYAPHVYTNSTGTPGPPSTGQYLGFYSSGSTSEYSYAIMPAFASGVVPDSICFKYKLETGNQGELTYGYITGTDESTYVALCEPITSASGTINVSLNTSNLSGKRLAFRWYKSSTWYTCGVDDVKVMRKVPTTSYSWSPIANDAISPYTITGCNIGTTYKARVKDQCNTSSSTSNEVEFTPACTAPTNLVAHSSSSGAVLTWDGGTDEEYTVQYRTYVPAYSTLLSEDFESMSLSTSYSSSGWYAYNAGSGNNWSLDDDSDYSYSGTHYILYPYNSSYAANCYLVSPPFAVSSNMTNLTVSLYERVNSSYPEQFEVFFVKASDVTTLSGVASVTHYSAIASTTYSNNSYTQITGSNSAAALAGTNVRVVVHCTSAADMDFVAIDDIEVTSQSGTFGSWTTITGTHEPPYNLTGLTTGTTYQAQVIDQCGNESNIVTFTPACGAPLNVAATPSNSSAEITWVGGESSYNVRYRETEVLFEEGFEDGIPSTWTIIDNDGDGYGWQIMGGTIHGGSGAVASASFINNVGALTPDNWLITPLINLRGTLEVWLSGYDENDYAEHFAIYLSTTGNSVSDFTTILVSETTTINGYLNYTANLDLYTGQQGYIAIRHFNCTNMYWLYVDDFGIYDSWQTASSNATSPYTLNGLTPNTDYEVQVQSTCGGDWVGTTFTTLPGYVVTAVADPVGSGTFAFSGGGVISSTATTAQVNPDGDVTVTATASTGYTFMNWIENGSVVSTTNAYSLSNVNESHTLTAHFVQQNTPDTWVTAVTSQPSGYSVSGSTVTISNANGLAWLISTVNGLNGQSGTAITSSTVINLTADVDMSAHIWVPIGTMEHPFIGTFNGNGHTISGVTRALEFPNQGVFGYVSGGTIHDVVVNTNITGDCNYMGSVAGTLASGTVYNTGSTGTVTANTNTIAVGGTVGYNGGLVHSSFATGTFTGLAGDYVGGLVGENAPAGRLYNSYSNATLTGGKRGGLVGYNKGTAANCYNVNNSATYAYANINAGTMEYVYSDNTNNSYYNTIEGSATLQHHGSSFSAVQSDIKHLDYMYRDNAITLATGQTNSYVPSSVSYANGHTIKWNGLVSALNQWVEANKTSGATISTMSSWYRPLTTAINGDLPVLGFGGETTLGAADGSPKALKYGTMDELLTAYNNSTASIFHYGKATGVTRVPTANVNVFIAEDAVLLQTTTNPSDFTATVGVTFDNSDHGTHAYDYWGNKLDYDWHLLSTPLSNLKTGATHSSYQASGNPWSYVDITAIGGYFPNGLITPSNPAVGGSIKWDFYTYYEPEYHWINLKRNKKNHYHQDSPNDIIVYEEADQDLGGGTAKYIPGKGYEMAISQDSYMNAKGTLNKGAVTITLNKLEPSDINYQPGANLVGNPYQGYLDLSQITSTYSALDKFYIYDADQGVFAPVVDGSSSNPVIPSKYIHPHQAFFVLAPSNNFTLTFQPTWAGTTTGDGDNSHYRDDADEPHFPLVNLFAEDAIGHRDLTVIEFHRPDLGGAEKLDAMRNAPFNLAAHYAGTSYGIFFATDDMERIPVRFKTEESGLVTLTWSTHNGEFRKLLLIDNKLGVEHNMLADNSYTFEASPDDYSSRFYIVYDCSGMGIEENEDDGGALTGSATFAYISHGNIVIDVGTSHGASLQIIDVLGRVLYSKTIAGTEGTYTVSTRGLAKGVYLIRLADGHNVKTQKLVVQ